MIIESVLKTLHDTQNVDKEIDYVQIEWYNSKKKIDRLKTDSGIELGLRLNEETASKGLRQNDILFEDDEKMIVVNIMKCECLLIRVLDLNLIAKVCYEIGNKHTPFFYGNSPLEFVTPYDKPLEKLLEKLNHSDHKHIELSMEERKINLNKNISNSLHNHTH